MKWRFIRMYGWDAWRNDSYLTRDRVIPFKLFVMAMDVTSHVLAAEQWLQVHSVAHGVAISLGGKDQKVRRMTRKLARLAFPVERDEDAS